MNTLCLHTSLSFSATRLVPLLSSSSHALSPLLLSCLRGGRSVSTLRSLKKININIINNNNNKYYNNINNSNSTLFLRKKNSINTNYCTQPPLFRYSSPNLLLASSPLLCTRTLLERGRGGGGGRGEEKRTEEINFQQKRGFRATQPQYAGVHAFRLASFVAPIILRGVKSWIGTPRTNAYFYRRLMLVFALLFGLPGIYIYTHLETTPYTDRVRFVALTSDDEASLGELAFNQLIDEHEPNFIPDHHRFVAHVTDVANRIIEACDRPDIKWEVRLIDSPVTNAFAIPGGKIFVFSGLLDVTQNDDGLAFILGHEVAHVLARHGAEQMTVGRVMLGVSVMLSAVFGDNIGSFFLSRVISLLTELRYSRSMESEADYIGLLLMHKAKFDISEAPRVWERMIKMTGGGDEIPFFSTHPSHSDRIQDISKWVDEIRAEQKVLTE